jgi:hypothetical protein
MNSCPNCQTQNIDQAKICANCGQPLTQVTPPRDKRSGGVEISGGQMQVGGDVAGRDVVKVTQTGLGALAVQRLVITIGGLVLAVGFCFLTTAACFFSGGVVLSAAVFTALNRPVETSPEAAQRLEQRLKDLNALSSGQTFSTTTTEIESSSYLHFILGPQIGVSEPKVRYIQAGQIVVSGRWTGLGNVPFVAAFRIGAGASPMDFEWMAVQVLQNPNSNFGWVAVPSIFVQSQATQVMSSALGQLKLETITDVTPAGASVPRVWQVTGAKR